jgi:hypothetical protein
MARSLNPAIENSLQQSSLWNSRLKKDCFSQNVFFTIRNNQIDIYHKGGRLFCFDKDGYKTHIKYASVITSIGKDYLTEKALSGYKLAADFEKNYTRIKENCFNYSGLEALGVSELYHKYSYLSDSDVVVLDIEVSFKSLNEKNKQDRIDILLYKKSTKTLQFVEAKHYSNPELWVGPTPKAIGQVKRYESQISKKKAILSEYSDYVKTLNRIFNLSLPKPIEIEDKVTLLIFGFDDDQKKGRLKKGIIEKTAYKGIKNYNIGVIKKLKKMETLWNSKVL